MELGNSYQLRSNSLNVIVSERQTTKNKTERLEKRIEELESKGRLVK